MSIKVVAQVVQNSSVASNHSRRADVPKELPEKKKMAKNPDKSYGWYKAQDFSDYIEEVVGEINFISVQVILTTILR